jgi:hypothetical protein
MPTFNLTFSRSLAIAAVAVATILSGCVGIRQQQNAARNAEIAAIQAECKNKRLSGELKGFVGQVNCANPRIQEVNRRYGSAHMDLLDMILAKRLELAEKVDNHQMTGAQADVAEAEYKAQVTEIAHRRNLENSAAQAISDQATAAKTNAYTGMINTGAGMMTGGNSGRIICYNNPMASGTMPNPTVCQGF